MDSNVYNEKMYRMLKVARQSNEMPGWNDKLSVTLDGVHKNLEKYKAAHAPQAEMDEKSL